MFYSERSQVSITRSVVKGENLSPYLFFYPIRFARPPKTGGQYCSSVLGTRLVQMSKT